MPERPGEPLRLLVVGATWPPQTFLGRLMRGLAASGIDVRLAFQSEPNRDWFRQAGLRSMKVWGWGGSRLLRLVRMTWLVLRAFWRAPAHLRLFLAYSFQAPTLTARLRRLYRLLPFAGVSCDVLYFPWNSAAIDFIPLFDLGTPAIVSCRGSQVNVAPYNPRRQIRDGLPITFAKATLVHCISRAIQLEAEKFGLDVEKSRVIHPGIDPTFFVPPVRRDDGDVLRIVTVGSLVWVKGTTYALQAIRLLLDAGVRATFSIVGDGPERQRVLFTIEELGLQQHVKLLGRLPPVTVRDTLRAHDVFVLASLSEGFCNAAVEAMACELPVVMTNCGGMREGVIDGVEGFVVPLRDSAAMAEALVRLAADPALRRRLGRAGRERVLKQFTIARHVQQFVALLREAKQCRVA